MLDLIYLTHNRLEFTRFSFSKLLANTNWGLVNRLILYDDSSIDGTREYLISAVMNSPIGLPTVIHRDVDLGGPVSVMLDYLGREGMPTFAKIDNDAVVPPGWLDHSVEGMRKYPQLDILGIEPPLSRKRPINTGLPLINPEELKPGPVRWVRTRSIGGLGLMRRKAFESEPPMAPHHTYGGFTEWQQANSTKLNIGWIAPPLNLFLLDRVHFAPWVDLSKVYIGRGWQRPWGMYSDTDSELWNWCPEMVYANARHHMPVGQAV